MKTEEGFSEPNDRLKESIKKKYSEFASQIVNSGSSSCCEASCCDKNEPDTVNSNLYKSEELLEIPNEALLASLGCGNPTALAKLNSGDIVLDLGSGGGIDVLLAAKKVGPGGKVYGVDMSDEMIALARANQVKAGISNVEFLKGDIENIPLPDSSVDIIISNCVINLAADKGRVLKESFRVLKRGGRFAVSDIVVRGEIPQEIRRSVELWIGCLAGALEEQEYKSKLIEAGFIDIRLEPTRVYRIDDAWEILKNSGIDFENRSSQVNEKFMSAFVYARKPGETG
jgi:ubiquinone/menaquinone biosynthesis C-methylase UbiE